MPPTITYSRSRHAGKRSGDNFTFLHVYTQSKPRGVAYARWRLCVRRLSLRLMHTPPMRVFGLGLGLELEPIRAHGWVGISMDNVTRTPAVGVPWGPSKPDAPYRSLIAHARVLVTLSMLIPTQPCALLGSNSNPNPNPKTRIGGVCINLRLSRRTHNLH